MTSQKTKQLNNPISLDTSEPRFGWELESDSKSALQTGYHILVASTVENLKEGKADLWDSGKVNSGDSQWITYGGKPLTSNQRGYWSIKSCTTKGESAWSKPAVFSVGPLKESPGLGQ